MFCYNCGCDLSEHNYCTACGADVSIYKKIMYVSNMYYNEGLEKANVRDLTGAVNSLRQSIKFNKNNIEARNLLGLVYFEMGEVVAALSEWVISKNIRPQKNMADDYIGMIQNNATRLDALNQTIKKYNQALLYCEQDSRDLAILQLKKVLSLNPKFIRAHLLLGLLCIDAEDWERAEREVKKCLEIDKNNTMALKYMSEIESMLVPDESVKTNGRKKKDEAVRVMHDNEVIIQPLNVKEQKSSIGQTFINILIGLVLGAGVVYFLGVPAAVAGAKAEADENANKISNNLAAETAKVQDLENVIESLQNDYAALSGELEGVVGENGTLAEIDMLLDIAADYINNSDESATAEQLEKLSVKVDLEETSGSFNALYEALFESIGPEIGNGYFEDGMQAYRNEDYLLAIDLLTKAVYYDPSNGDALFNLGNSYRKNGSSNEDAVAVYEKVIELFPGTEKARNSQRYIDSLIQIMENNPN